MNRADYLAVGLAEAIDALICLQVNAKDPADRKLAEAGAKVAMEYLHWTESEE